MKPVDHRNQCLEKAKELTEDEYKRDMEQYQRNISMCEQRYKLASEKWRKKQDIKENDMATELRVLPPF